ncbi:peptidoglycan synthetase [Puteibacter caeruleilacunae]|nr:peptidoglycan synthetase [Puteibacter caeruleilacunae]
MRVHFIAIGGSAMHNLAIALHEKGYDVSGSDDEIFEPSRSRLEKHGILPQHIGWAPDKITTDLDAVILGMHARIDNPELLRAQELGVKVYSYPEYLYEQTKDKKRVVIGGSHGKTTITSMIMHVLNFHHIDFDYMVGAQLDGFETMVRLNDTSKIAVFEGDEYLSSPIDRRPKFHLYHPHVALLSGVAWDHINVFPTFEGYVDQFRQFANMVEDEGSLIYFEGDNHLQEIASGLETNVTKIAYGIHPHVIDDGNSYLCYGDRRIRMSVFGDHNLQNINGARLVCNEIGVSDEDFYKAIGSFKGASRRLQILAENEQTIVYHDFAHSPSKLKATTSAVKKQFTDRRLVACMELHTFSSLKKDFLPEYNGAMDEADLAIVYFNPQTIEHKKLEPITKEQVAAGFNNEKLVVYTDSDQLFEDLKQMDFNDANLLLMSSGNFSGKDLKEFAVKLTGNPVNFKNTRWYSHPVGKIN